MRPEPTADLRPWFLTLEDLEPPIDWTQFFGNPQPVELDVGSGRGLFLVNAGRDNPSVNYLGIEIDYSEGRRAARRLKKRDSANVRVLGGDARVALRKYVPPESVAAVHVYFPDPWWKKRQKKRTLFTDEFVHLLERVLKPGGLVHSWTDVTDYFRIVSALMDHDDRFETLPAPQERPPADDMDFQTSYERKRRQAGETVHRGLWRKKS